MALIRHVGLTRDRDRLTKSEKTSQGDDDGGGGEDDAVGQFQQAYVT